MRQNRERVLTIGGSDSSGGAGIQADIKTFSALGVCGTSVICAITAQNSTGVQDMQEVSVKLVKSQLESIIGDMAVDYAKTGMLYSVLMIKTVAALLKKHYVPFVLDPVMKTGSGSVLMEQDSLNTLVTYLLPLCQVITPNVPEASAISGLQIKTLDDAKEAAAAIHEQGAPVVIIKGGHLEREIEAGKATDLIYNGDFKELRGRYVNAARVVHGAGCSFSAALAAELAKGNEVLTAATRAKEFVRDTISHGDIVSNLVVVNHAYRLREDADRYYVLENVKEAVRMLKSTKKFERIIPEVGTNIGMAIEYAETKNGVAAVDGRIRATMDGIRAGEVDFGVSSHVARMILAVMKRTGENRSAINVKYTPELIAACKGSGLVVSSFDRAKEPAGEATMDWGVNEALRKRGLPIDLPDVIYDLGAVGKEPMVRVFDNTAVRVVLKLRKILNVLCEE